MLDNFVGHHFRWDTECRVNFSIGGWSGLINGFQKEMSEPSSSPVLENEFGNKVFADGVKLRVLRWDHPGFRMGPESYGASPVAQQVKNPPAMQETQEMWAPSPWVGKISWKRKWQPILVFLPRKSHGQRSLVGCSSWGRKSQTWLSD